MKKRLLCLAISAMLVMQTLVFAQTSREAFTLDVGMLTESQIANINQNFTKIDLRPYMNRDIRDEVEGDGTGGWSDQGENDLRMFDLFGDQEMLNVPFTFVDPATNNQKAVLGLRGQNDMELPASVEIPINRTTAGAYFIHASPWCSGTCGTYSWVYEDGSEAYIDIVQNEQICDFWGLSNYDYVRNAWNTTKADGSYRSLYLFAMNNPYPEKTVKSLKLETEGSGAYIMIMAITLTDSGPYLPATESARSITTSTYGWYEYTQPDDDKITGSALDFSGYLDAPAGKHGYARADGNGLVFEDGTKAKFWGVDITGEAALPEKEQAEKVAKRLAQSGVNLVRLEGFDEAILGDGDSSTTPDPEKLDRLFYLIAQLKERGIYTYISLLSNRKMRAGDGIEGYEDSREGYGIDAYFDDRVIELQKQYLSNLMGQENPYTGLAPANDPAVCFLEFVEGLSVFDYTSGYGRGSVANEAQYENIKAKFNEYLAGKYSSTEELQRVWVSVYDKNDYETIEEKNIELKTSLANPLVSDGYRTDVAEFLATVAGDYYADMKAALGDSKILTTINSNSPEVKSLEDTYLNAGGDFLTRTWYNAKPYGNNDKITIDSVFDTYDSMTQKTDNIVRDFAQNTVSGKPFVANWGSAMPNLYFSEASIMMAALAGQKDWIGVQHSFANEAYSDINYIDDFYSIYNNPVRLALLPVSASIYYSLEAETEQEYTVYTGDVHNTAQALLNQYTVDQAFAGNTRLRFVEGTGNAKSTNSSTRIIKTNNIYWDTNMGLFEVRSGRTEALSGFLTDPEEMPTFSIDVDNTFVTAALTSLDGNEIGDAGHYLLTALCGNQNYRARVNLVRNHYETLGEERIVVEAITGSVTIKRQGDYEVYPLTSSGERKQALPVEKDRNGYTTFRLSSDSEAIQYEIIKK